MIKLFVFGPSCSGKSILTQALAKKLGSQWTRIDRDDLIEQKLYSNEDANRLLDEKIQNRFIIDAQIPWREKQEGEFYFLVLPPLKILLERDALRTIRLNRGVEQAERAQKYVINTHTTLDQTPKDIFNACLDSSKMSLEEEVLKIQEIIKNSL